MKEAYTEKYHRGVGNLEKHCAEKGDYIICDLTGYVLPDGFEAQMEGCKKESTGGYDFNWTLDVYTYFSQNLPDLIVEGTVSEAA